jgi:Spy/CpxP family protein refolding chaperone
MAMVKKDAANAEAAGTSRKALLRKWGPVVGIGTLLVVGISVLALRSRTPPRPSAFAREAVPLLEEESVQQELQMSLDQVARITSMAQQRKEEGEAWRELPREERERRYAATSLANEKEVRKLLDEEQIGRLNQICLQQRGTRIWGDEQVVKTLALTHDQRVQLAKLRDTYDDEMQKLRRDDPETKAKAAALRKSTDEKLLAVLTPEQLDRWNALVGTPVMAPITRPRGRFGARRGGWGGGWGR